MPSGYWVVRYASETGEPEPIASAEREAAVCLDGWIFDSKRHVIEDERGEARRDEAAIKRWRAAYNARRRYVESHGSKLVLAIAPTKGAIYPEYLPAWRHPVGDKTRLSFFIEAMRPDGLDILDLGPALLRHKHRGQLYLRYDTHWNALGALIGAAGIVEHLRRTDDRVPLLDLSRYACATSMPASVAIDDGHPLDLARMLGLPFLQESQPVVTPRGEWAASEEVSYRGPRAIRTYCQDNSRLPTAVCYVDSFGASLRRPLAEHFRRSVFVNPWEVYDQERHDFPLDLIAEERADYVIVLRWQHAILVEIGNPPEMPAARSFGILRGLLRQ